MISRDWMYLLLWLWMVSPWCLASFRGWLVIVGSGLKGSCWLSFLSFVLLLWRKYEKIRLTVIEYFSKGCGHKRTCCDYVNLVKDSAIRNEMRWISAVIAVSLQKGSNKLYTDGDIITKRKWMWFRKWLTAFYLSRSGTQYSYSDTHDLKMF